MKKINQISTKQSNKNSYYRIAVKYDCPYIAQRNGGNREVDSRLSLKCAQQRLLDLNEQQEVEKNLNNNFWKWFGNSKVVDDNGNPQIFYHGTNASFNKFKIDPELQKYGWTEGKGFYFSKIKPHAYGKNIIACYLKIENPIYGLDYVFSEVELSKLGFYNKPLVKKETTEYGTYITIQTHPLLPPIIDLNTNENTSIENYKPVIRPITYKRIIGMFSYLYPNFDIVDSIKNKLNYDGVIF